MSKKKVEPRDQLGIKMGNKPHVQKQNEDGTFQMGRLPIGLPHRYTADGLPAKKAPDTRKPQPVLSKSDALNPEYVARAERAETAILKQQELIEKLETNADLAAKTAAANAESAAKATADTISKQAELMAKLEAKLELLEKK